MEKWLLYPYNEHLSCFLLWLLQTKLQKNSHILDNNDSLWVTWLRRKGWSGPERGCMCPACTPRHLGFHLPRDGVSSVSYRKLITHAVPAGCTYTSIFISYIYITCIHTCGESNHLPPLCSLENVLLVMAKGIFNSELNILVSYRNSQRLWHESVAGDSFVPGWLLVPEFVHSTIDEQQMSWLSLIKSSFMKAHPGGFNIDTG